MKIINLIFFLLTNLYWGFSQVAAPIQVEQYVVIKPVFENASDFEEGMAPVLLNNKWGYIDNKGKNIIDFKFEYASSLAEGYGVVLDKNYYKYIDKNGAFLSKKEYNRASAFSENLAAFSNIGEKKFGFLDTKEVVRISPTFDRVKSFSEGLAPAKKDNKWGYIEKDGKFRINAIFEEAGVFSESLAAVKTAGKWGFIDNTAKLVIPATYENASNFREGLCGVMQNGLYGYIDSKGKTVINFQYEEALGFSEGLAPVKKSGKWGYIDKSGKWVVDPVLENAGIFSEGLAYFALTDNGKAVYGYMSNPLKKPTANTTTPVKATDKKETGNQDPKPKPGAMPAGGGSDEVNFVPCDETQSGWQGEITRIHGLKPGVTNIVVKWEIINNPYSISVSSGKGKKAKKLFNASKAKYSGYKKIKLPAREEYLTVVISAKKADTQWKYTIECE